MSAGHRSRWKRVVLLILIYGALLAVGNWGGGWLSGVVGAKLGHYGETHELAVMVGGTIVYAAFMAVPFVPGVEIGLGLLAVFGPKIAVALYVATVLALTFSWVVGRMFPARLMAALFASLGLRRARSMVERLAPLSAVEKVELLLEHVPTRIVPVLLKHRYLAVMVLLNTPGNAVIGGGGGIALLAGMSGLFTFPRFVGAVSLAVLPVPLFILLAAH